MSEATSESSANGSWNEARAKAEFDAREEKTANAEAVIRAEHSQIALTRLRREQPALPTENTDDHLVGLAISGGGIRSASIALGIIQSFAREGKLERFDYLSTVSGGGYLGSAISWFLSRKDQNPEFGLSPENFPFGTDWPGTHAKDSERQKALMRYLRQHGNYLLPGDGLNALAGASAVIRAIFVNLAVWIPVITALLWLGMATSFNFKSFSLPESVCCGQMVACDGAAAQCSGIASISRPEAWPFQSVEGWLVIAIAFFAIVAVLYSMSTGVGHWFRSYSLRRFLEEYSGKALGIIILLAVVVSLPWLASYVGEQRAVAGGFGAAVLGVGSGVYSFFKSAGSGGKSSTNLVAILGSILLLYGLLFLGYWAALYINESPGVIDQYKLWAIVLLAVASGYIVNLNDIGLHRFYRDRLMETFLPPVNKVLAAKRERPYTGPSPRADKLKISELRAGDLQSAHPGPYHLVNTNVVLVDSRNKRLRSRGGESFLLSPLYCGSDSTEWLDSKAFMKDGMTLATAMSISGAAANPNTGVGGAGVTRSKAMSILMALLNIRLGYWTTNPKRWQFFRVPSHFRSALYELLPRYHEDARHLQLSDGGHFENLALYELIRRRVQVIVVTDGGQDENYLFGDLRNALDRIRVDFKVRVTFDSDNKLEKLIPYERSQPHYPTTAPYADQSHIVGVIHYPAVEEKRDEKGNVIETSKPRKQGTLIYCKSTMLEDIGIRTKGYKATNPQFPHESTADQFFSEDQLEAYRTLGNRIGMNAVGDLAQAVLRH